MAHRSKHRGAERSSRQRELNLNPDWSPAEAAAEPAPTEPRTPTAYEEAVLLGLQRKPHVYQGPDAAPTRTGRRLTDDKIIARRVRGRIAKRSRKINRRNSNAAPVAFLMLFAMLFGGALFYASPSQAFTRYAPLTVSATWIGGDCWGRTATHPADSNPWTLSPAIVVGCTSGAVEYQHVQPGQFFGIDPDIGDAFAVSCTVTNTALDRIVFTDYASKGNGHNASCLGRWS